MADAKGDIQHHIGYAYHKLNDRRLMWIEYLEEKIAACRQRLRESGKWAETEPPVVAQAQAATTGTGEAEPQAQEEVPAATTAQEKTEPQHGDGEEESEGEAGLW